MLNEAFTKNLLPTWELSFKQGSTGRSQLKCLPSELPMENEGF